MIDEKKLIQDIHNYFKDTIDKSGLEVIDNDLLTLNKDICTIVKNQPKVGEWIPCSERLPKDREEVLITDSNGRRLKISFNMWLYENPQYSHNIIPIAWMPLPAPYNAKRGGKNESR